MRFTVTYRNTTGEKTSETLEAASRGEAFQLLSARGIRPLSVVEAAGSAKRAAAAPPDGAGKVRGTGELLVRAAIGVLAVAAVGIVAWIVVGGRKSGPTDVDEPPAVVSDTSTVNVPATEGNSADDSGASAAETAAEAADTVAAAGEPETSTATPASTFKKPWDGKPPRVIPRKPKPPSIFKHHSEDMIARVLEISPGTQIMGVFPERHWEKFREDFIASLNEPIEILETDSEYDRMLKQAVADTKEELRQRMDAGEDPAAVIKSWREELRELGIYRQELMSELRDLRKSGQYTAEEYKQFVADANKLLAEKGIDREITVPAVVLRNMELNQQKQKSQK